MQVSLNNHCHSIVLSLCENTKQFSCSAKAYGPLAHKFLQSRCGQVLVGSFFDYCDNEQGTLVLIFLDVQSFFYHIYIYSSYHIYIYTDERVSLGKEYPFKGYAVSVGNAESVPNPPTLTPPPDEASNNIHSFTCSLIFQLPKSFRHG